MDSTKIRIKTGWVLLASSLGVSVWLACGSSSDEPGGAAGSAGSSGGSNSGGLTILRDIPGSNPACDACGEAQCGQYLTDPACDYANAEGGCAKIIDCVRRTQCGTPTNPKSCYEWPSSGECAAEINGASGAASNPAGPPANDYGCCVLFNATACNFAKSVKTAAQGDKCKAECPTAP